MRLGTLILALLLYVIAIPLTDLISSDLTQTVNEKLKEMGDTQKDGD